MGKFPENVKNSPGTPFSLPGLMAIAFILLMNEFIFDPPVRTEARMPYPPETLEKEASGSKSACGTDFK
jgi:hypothetical protein